MARPLEELLKDWRPGLERRIHPGQVVIVGWVVEAAQIRWRLAVDYFERAGRVGGL